MATENDVTHLYDSIRDYLDFSLVVMTNRTYWEEMNTVSDDDIRMYNDTIADAINPCYDKYRGTAVQTILEQMEYVICTSVRTGMSTAYPLFHNEPYAVERHMDRVVVNTMRIVDEFYDDLMYEMFIANRQVKKIQEYWKRAISNPEYTLCRARLMKEWVEFDLTIKSVREAQPSLAHQGTAITA